MRLSLHRLWVDTNGMLQMEVFLEGGGYSATQDVYVYPDELRAFAERLKNFPSSIADEAVLEIGSTQANAYCWLKLRAYVYDALGHSALELSVQRNTQHFARSQFSVVVEAASLNALGEEIANWASANEEPLVFERA